MNRLSLFLLLSLGGFCLQGQTSSPITISTKPAGARFEVDGTTYNAAVTFDWPTGSTHYVIFITDPPSVNGSTALVQTSTTGDIQYSFSGWQDNNGLVQPSGVPVQVITANPAITTFTAAVGVSYRFTVSYYGNPNQPQTIAACGAPGVPLAGQHSPGVVYLGGQCSTSSFTTFLAAGTTETLNAYPFPGYAFTGWTINGSNPTPFLTTLTINNPMTIAPIFVPAKRVSFLDVAPRTASSGGSHPGTHPNGSGRTELPQ